METVTGQLSSIREQVPFELCVSRGLGLPAFIQLHCSGIFFVTVSSALLEDQKGVVINCE